MRLYALGLACALLLSACAPGAAATPAGGSLVLLAEAGDVDPALLSDFTRTTGIEVTISEYTDEDEALSLLDARPADVLIAGDQLLARLIAENRLAPLDTASLVGFAAVEGRLKDMPFDRGNRFSVPFRWGTIGILYRTNQSLAFDSWSGAFDAARAGKVLAGKIALLAEPHAALGAAARTLGFSLNAAQAREWAQARDVLARLKTVIRFDSAAWSSDLLTGDVLVAQAYSDDAVFAQTTNPDLRYVIPREGTSLWMRSLTVPTVAARRTEARRFIEFLLQPANAARTSAFTYSLSPIGEAYNRMDTNLAGLLRSATPDETTFRRSEFAALNAETRRFVEQLWAELNP